MRFGVIAAIILLRWRSVRVERLVWWPSSVALAVIATAITAAGLLLALWARVVLGSLWSSEVAIKRQHSVIDHGPYAFVRHPIYSAILLMLLGTALWSRHAIVLGVVVVAFIALRLKAHAEERLLTEHLGDAYRNYKSRVRWRLFPGVV